MHGDGIACSSKLLSERGSELVDSSPSLSRTSWSHDLARLPDPPLTTTLDTRSSSRSKTRFSVTRGQWLVRQTGVKGR
ncbi:hypothetical protein VYU27_009362 [Nannochloropsis oceanica]